MALLMKSNLSLFIGLLMTLLNANDNAYAQTKPTTASPDSIVEPPVGQRGAFSDKKDASEAFNENDSIQKLKRSREFAYMNNLDSLLRMRSDLKNDTVSFDESTGRIIRNKKQERDVSGINQFLNSTPLRIFFWVLAFLFIGFISYRLLFKNDLFRRKRNKTKENDEEGSVHELADLTRYDAFIAEAENDHDYNIATRYLFLKTLKNLADKGCISFAAGKTNTDYLREMKANPYSKEFESLTRDYEYRWYGKLATGTSTYQQLKERFSLFNQRV